MAEPGQATAAEVLGLATGGRRFGRRAAIVVAHPDDETLGAFSQFGRFERLTLVHVTDGAPRSLDDARRAGFGTAADYAAARARELAAALAIAGHDPRHRSTFAIADQQAAFAVRRTAQRLTRVLRGVDLVFTHACEGGHPDHDAVAVAVHAAVQVLAEAGQAAPAVLAMPLYRDDGEGRFLRGFEDARPRISRRIALRGAPLDRKGAMIASFVSQAPTLGRFDLRGEDLRLVGPPRLDRLPNRGRILYTRFGWGLDPIRLMRLARRARLDLGLHPITGRARVRKAAGREGRPWH